MIIRLEIKVESTQALATILKVGSDYALFDYKVIEFEILKTKKKEG